MALQLPTMTLPTTGLSVQNAYARVSHVSGNKHNISFTLDIFASREAADSGLQPISSTLYNFVSSVADDALNIIKQCYEHVKTFDDFADAIDV